MRRRGRPLYVVSATAWRRHHGSREADRRAPRVCERIAPLMVSPGIEQFFVAMFKYHGEVIVPNLAMANSEHVLRLMESRPDHEGRQVMQQQVPGPRGPVGPTELIKRCALHRPLELIKHFPGEAFAASDRLRWVGL